MAATAAVPAPAQTPAARLRQLGGDALYLLTGLATSILAFTVWVVGVSLSLSLGLLIIGFPIVIASFWCFRLLADLERKRAALVFGMPIVSAYRPTHGKLGSRLKIAAHDAQRWKDVAYLALHGILGFIAGTLWLVLVASCSAASRCRPGGGRCPAAPSGSGSRSTRGRRRSARPRSASRSSPSPSSCSARSRSPRPTSPRRCSARRWPPASSG
jgi:hypothetical protein